MARDDIDEAYAGKENAGRHNDGENAEDGGRHSTNVKARVTEKSKGRTPER